MSARFSRRLTRTQAWQRRFRQGSYWFLAWAHGALLLPSRADAQAPPYQEWRGERVPPPGPVAEPEPPPWERPLELSRKPVEIASEVGVSLPLCARGASEMCSALGAAFDAAAVVLYRPSPYFAAGGALSFWAAGGRMGERVVEQRVVALGARLRVYLMEWGELDPYLELGFGFAEVRAGVRPRLETELVPFAEVGGGADVLLGHRLRLGAGVSVSDVFGASTSAQRRVAAVFRVAFSFGEPL